MADINSGGSGSVRDDAANRSAVPATVAVGGEADEALVGLVELLFFAYRDFTGEADEVLGDLGYGRAHHRVLHFVNRQPGLRVADLLDILRITKQSLARVLKQLVDDGYIEQMAGMSDRRERRLYVTFRGESLARELMELQAARVGAALAQVGEGSEASLRAFLFAMIGPEQRATVVAAIANGDVGAGRSEVGSVEPPQAETTSAGRAEDDAPPRATRTRCPLMCAATSAGPGPRREPLPDNAPHILLVDDDQRIRELLARVLADQGFRVTPAGDVAAARAAMRSLAFDLVLLDVMMPGTTGLEFARELKAQMPIPICMLTARSETEDKIEGLEAGVDDYVTKPFEPRELILRIKNILRRGSGAPGPGEEIRMGEMTFHMGRGELRRGDETIKLTERERDLLRLFGSRPGLPIARHELSTDDTTGSERSIDVQINRLRRKIEGNPSNPVYLQTARGKGYVLFTD